MKGRRIHWMVLAGCAAFFLPAVNAADRFVWTNSPAPDGQFLTWETAARNIQAAIDVAAPGDVIIVTNGVYDRGGVRGYPPGTTLTNRVAIYKPVTVRSVNGPSNTVIVGRWHVPGDTNYIFGSNAVRCVYMTNGAVLAGFTLTNGATLSYLSSNEYTLSCGGAGIYCHSTDVIITNCLISGNRGCERGGGVRGGTVYNCTIMGNALFPQPYIYPYMLDERGGGVFAGNVYNSLIERNYSAYAGGGAGGCRLHNCVVVYNSCESRGGGAELTHLYNCFVGWNRGPGGGVYASWGSMYDVYNCVLVGNYSTSTGGGAYEGRLCNCTVTGNSAASGGGGIHFNSPLCEAWNCIVYNNQTAGVSSNFSTTNANFYYSCAVPMPPGVGNIAADPMFKQAGVGYGLSHMPGDYRLANGSPCVNTGTNFSWMTNVFDIRSKDLDGGPRIYFGTVDMGAYERIPPGTIFMLYGK